MANTRYQFVFRYLLIVQDLPGYVTSQHRDCRLHIPGGYSTHSLTLLLILAHTPSAGIATCDASTQPDLDVDFTPHYVQLLSCLHLEEVQEVGHRAQQDAATDADGLGQLPLLILHRDGPASYSAWQISGGGSTLPLTHGSWSTLCAGGLWHVGLLHSLNQTGGQQVFSGTILQHARH